MTVNVQIKNKKNFFKEFFRDLPVTVYNNSKVWYNSIVKRLAVLTTSLLLTLTAAGGAMSAFAEGSATAYPVEEDFIKTLTFSDLKNFDIDGNTYYFSDGEKYYKYEQYENSNIGELGEFIPEEDFAFSPALKDVSTEKYYYYFDDNEALTAYEKSSKTPQTFEGEYSNLKQFNDRAYAVKENVLYRFENAQEPEPVLLKFVDYEVTRKIPVGQAEAALKNYGDLEFVTVKAGEFLTAVDLTSLDGEYFLLENTEDDVSVNTVTFAEDKTALLLCRSGNAAIVSIGDSSFVTLSTSVTENPDVNCREPIEVYKATLPAKNGIYASPFTVKGTMRTISQVDTVVTVTGKIEYEDVLKAVYYEVEYETDEGSIKGYVAEGLLFNGIIEDTKQPETKPDPEYTESTGVTTVLLILAVVVLVLVALGYLAHTATSGRKKKKEKPAEETKE